MLDRLRRWLTPASKRPLIAMIEAWLGDRGSDVLVIEHRFSRCELRHEGGAVVIWLPAATLLLRHATSPTTAPEAPYDFDPELGSYQRRYVVSGSLRALGESLAHEVQTLVDRYFERPVGVSPVLTREPGGLVRPSDLEAPGPFTLAMRNLARSRTFEDRRLVYQAFVNGTFLAPLRHAEGGGSMLEMLPAEQVESGASVWAVFTNWKDAAQWRRSAGKGAKPWAVFSGLQLMALAARNRPSSILLNPGGNVGGEFLSHELDRLAEALHLQARSP